ncbi:MAG TPA: response regulator [Gemmatimonadales bacterium]|nr:response regulator [Gemmatimonadales bacterium]
MTRAPAPRPSRPRHLLVVDDEPHIGLLLRPELESRGFQVSLARSLGEARAALAGIDAMLLDLHLPDGSGIDFLRELREHAGTRDLPVLVLTGEGGDRILDEARRLGAGLLTKPFSPTKLATRLTTLVGEMGTGDAP